MSGMTLVEVAGTEYRPQLHDSSSRGKSALEQEVVQVEVGQRRSRGWAQRRMNVEDD